MSIKSKQLLLLCGNVGHLVEGPILNGSIKHLDNGISGAVVVDRTLCPCWPDLQHVRDTWGLARMVPNSDSQIALSLKGLIKLTLGCVDAVSI